MTESDMEAAAWGPVLLSAALAIVIPIVTVRWVAQRQRLREHWLYSRRGAVVAVCCVYAAILSVFTAGVVVAATTFSFLWATAAMCLSCLLSVAIYLTSYLRTARDFEAELLRSLDVTSDEDAEPSA